MADILKEKELIKDLDFINMDNLTKKIEYILKELDINKTEFLNECKKYNSSMSKPTLFNLFKGNSKTLPSLNTIATIVKVCQHSGNENLKRVSFNYLLNDGINDIEAKNTQLYDEIGLNDDSIANLKRLNTEFIPLNRIDIINYYLCHASFKYWDMLDILKKTSELKSYIINKKYDKLKDLIDDYRYGSYIDLNFKDIHNNIDNIIKKYNKDKNYKLSYDKEQNLINSINILIVYLKTELIRIDNVLYDNFI